MRDLGTAYLLWFFLGIFGAHKFYLDRIGMGFAYLFTLGFFGIGWFIDMFTLPKQLKDADLLYMSRYYSGAMPGSIVQSPVKKKLSPAEKEKLVLQVAKNHGGRITPLEVAAETDLSVEEGEKYLKTWSDKGYCEIKISQNGVLLYEFSGFLSNDERNTASGLFD
ncbi:MAG: TM2 domain-containing protein [Spirochaetota bacterium]|nr:TM2 domain-containing protein [Spirochaetota bacterium]